MPSTQSAIQNPTASTAAAAAKSKISLIAAMGENRVIGRDGQLPWHVPADLKHFKRLTTGHTVIMGRKTFDSVGKPLPNRRNIVVTRNRDWAAPGVEVVLDLKAALAMAPGEEEIFILGGQQIFEMVLPLAHRIYLTLIHISTPGDAYFPPFEGKDWIESERGQTIPASGMTPGCTFLRYDRERAPC